MLITVRFTKSGNGTFVAHTDILRALNRTFRRAQIAVNYSSGFNKHMCLNLTQPLPLGVASEGEYVTADIINEMTAEEFLRKFNECCPPFLHGQAAYVTEKRPARASVVTASKFFFRSPEALAIKEKILSCKDGYTINYVHGGKEKTVDAAALIYDLTVNKEGIEALIASGNVNLRSDALSKSWNDDFGLHVSLSDIVRIEQYVPTPTGFITASEYLENLT